MSYPYDFSVIIPQKNSEKTLPRLFETIPHSSKIEIIVVDNSEIPTTKEKIGIDREYNLLWADPKRYAGGARNVGIENAHGKWLVFSDADDFFTPNAFDDFFRFKDSNAEVIYFGMDGIIVETGERTDRGNLFTNLVKSYLAGEDNETSIRTGFATPCSKMVSHDLVKRHNLRYDEVVANNDDFFALNVGFYAKTIDAYDSLVYVYVTTAGSIMHRRSLDVMRTRYEVILRCNQFKKQHGLGKYQGSVMYFLAESRHYGIKAMWDFFIMLFKFRQNPFIGMKNWGRTIKKIKKLEKKEAEFIVNK